jgi:Transcriptional regulator containing PAS, AAA-type ATPase, and DNA-binding domains
MDGFEWVKELGVAVTVCDLQGIVLYMNDKSERTFAKDGGKTLLGKNLMACHSNKSQSKIVELLSNSETNVYTIEKKGIKKLIFQTPWFTNGETSGLVELSMEIPLKMPHYIRE